MSTEVIAGARGEERASSTAGGGTALTTTAALIRLHLETEHIALTARNLSTAVVVQYHLNPWLTILKTADALATAPTNYSNAGQNAGAAAGSMVLSSLDTLANSNFLLVGSHLPIRGVLVDVNATNGNASVLTVHYWKGSWSDITATDGTASGGATFAVDGNVTWTVPSDWVLAKLSAIYTTAPNFPLRDHSMYWTRWSVSAAIDASVTIDRFLALNRSTVYAELVGAQTFEQKVRHGTPGGIGCVEAKTDAGTANLIVNCSTVRDGRFA